MTDISFTDAHLRTIEQALEVYTRLRLGQFDIAIDEAFPEAFFSHEERGAIHKFLRSLIFPEPPILRYNGHGEYSDQYNNLYNEQKEILGDPDWEMKNFLERANNMGIAGGFNSSYGIGHKKARNGGLAYEIRQTIRQYLAVKKNDGYFDNMCATYDDPCKATEEPLPIIKGFLKEKTFTVEDDKINRQLCKFFGQKTNKKWPKMRELIEKNCGLPDGIEFSRRRLNFNEDSQKWELILQKPTKKLKNALY
jgi:hypothetical protein